MLAALAAGPAAAEQDLLLGADMSSPAMTQGRDEPRRRRGDNQGRGRQADRPARQVPLRARFSGLNLRGVNLRTARLNKVNLRGADLSGANLEQAWFLKADLSGAKLADAKMFGITPGTPI